MKDLGELLKGASLFSCLSRKEIDSLLPACEIIELTRKEGLFQPGTARDKIYLIVDGGIKLQKVNGGEQFILEIFHSGEVVGEEALIYSDPSDVQAVPLDNATLLKIDARAVKSLRESNPRFAEACLSLLTERSRGYRTKMEDMVFKDVEARLVSALLKLGRTFGRRDKQGTVITARLTHQDLADYIGASRETVSLALSELRKRKLIRMNVRQFIIPEIKALREKGVRA